MAFKKLSLRTVGLLVGAGLVLLVVITKMLFSAPEAPQSREAVTTIESRNVEPEIFPNQAVSPGPVNKRIPIKETLQEDSQSMKEMKEQMDSDRLQQKKIKMLKLQLEQTNLQLEQEKARSQISKLEKENISVVNDSNQQGQDKYPDVKVVYIGTTASSKEAIVSINGNNYSVKEKNMPVKNVRVDAITDNSVTLHFSLPQDLKTTIEYKPE